MESSVEPTHYGSKSSAVKRIMQEAREIAAENSTDFVASPLENDIFEWHFTLRGPDETEFEGGLYHGRIILPHNYPFVPPEIMFLTPNGRFELNKKVCLSFTGYHPEYWQPAWGIRVALIAIMGFLPTPSEGAIGGLDFSSEIRKSLAVKSRTWVCDGCHADNLSMLPDVAPGKAHRSTLREHEKLPEFSVGYKLNGTTTTGNTTSSVSKTVPRKELSREELAQLHAAKYSLPAVGSSSPSSSTTSSFSLRVTSPAAAAAAAAALAREKGASTSTAPQASPEQPSSQPSVPVQDARTASPTPIWLDALILGLAGVLVAIVIRKFL